MSVPPSRAKAVQWARAVVANPDAVVLDLETTGLGEDAEICDIGIAAIDGTVLLDLLVKPTKPIPPDATKIHGIGDADVVDAPTWAEVWPLVELVLSGKTVIVYNAPYDTGVIKQVCKSIGVEVDLPAECCMLAFGEYDGTPGRFGKGFKWHKLDAAAARFNIDPGGHRALADTLVTRSVVLAMAADTSADELVATPLLDTPRAPINPDFWTQ